MNESYDPGNYLIAIGLIVFYWHLLQIWHQPPPDHTDKAASEQKSAALDRHRFDRALAPRSRFYVIEAATTSACQI